MISQQLLVGGIEHDPGVNQGSSLRHGTVGTAEFPPAAPALTPEDLEFMQQLELTVFDEQAETTLTQDDLDFMNGVELIALDDALDVAVRDIVDGAEALLKQEARGDTPVASRPEQRRKRRIGRIVGNVALSSAILVGALVAGVFGVTAAQSAIGKDAPQAQTKDHDRTEATQSSGLTQTTESQEAVSPTTTEPETVATTTPPKPFEAQPRDVIGSFEIPKICIDIQLVEVDSSEMPLIGETVEQGLPNGQVMADYLTPDPTPVEECAPVDQYARANPGFVQRLESTGKASAVGPGNPQGKTSYWQPIAVHENNDGHPVTAYPGQAGLTVLWGHRVTRSGTNMDVQVLEPGDPAYSHRADGKESGFVFRELLILNPDNIQGQLRDYYNRAVLESVASGGTEDVQMVALGGCADNSGNGGGDSKRVVSIFVGA